MTVKLDQVGTFARFRNLLLRGISLNVVGKRSLSRKLQWPANCRLNYPSRQTAHRVFQAPLWAAAGLGSCRIFLSKYRRCRCPRGKRQPPFYGGKTRKRLPCRIPPPALFKKKP